MSRKNIETRNRILESTWRLLETDPGNDVRMSDIAKEAGISRQAVYLHFPKRADLLVATTRYLDEVRDIDARLAASRAAKTGLERLDAFIQAWGNYIPEIYGVAKALLAMKDQDEEAYNAWQGRMQAVREGCEAAINALDRDGMLTNALSKKEATDLLWTMLSVRNWEQFRSECNWTQARYIDVTKASARKVLVADGA
ncbi:MAG: TetR/AcrR family transcriptional regulator [Rhizobiaceae bacterium]|nr:TetR/AcrR family transcriptional regulator [Rhizobiaceae bacterium]